MHTEKFPRFQLYTEHVRGEPRVYWVKRQDAHGGQWVSVSECTTEKRKAQGDFDRLSKCSCGRNVYDPRFHLSDCAVHKEWVASL